MNAGHMLFPHHTISQFSEVSRPLEVKLLVSRLSVTEYLIDRMFTHSLHTFEDLEAHIYHKFEDIPINFLHRATDFATRLLQCIARDGVL
jgi:hypothetical protein